MIVHTECVDVSPMQLSESHLWHFIKKITLDELQL